MSNGGDCNASVERAGEINTALERLESELSNLGCSVDSIQVRLVSVTRDESPKAGPADVAPPMSPASQVVLRLREATDRVERITGQLNDVMARLEV